MSDPVTAPVRLFLCGDVMTGRGIDQILPSPSDPVLHEGWVRDARRYVRLAEGAEGAIVRPVGWDYIWGDALAVLDRAAIDVRVVNLETSITRSDGFWPGKGIHYRMHPENIGCLHAARISCCCLANNHVLDWGYEGLAETLHTLDEAGIAHAGAGCDAAHAAAPAVMRVPGKGRVLVFSYGMVSSGIPSSWEATDDKAGVNLLADSSAATARRTVSAMMEFKRPGDIIVASIHWGGNWGYDISKEDRGFARHLLDEGCCIVHGHSSHHVKTIELHDGRLALYGCGDFLNDYEGIGGHENYRSDLPLIYLATVEPRDGRLSELRMWPMRIRRFRLCRASREDTEWLCDLLNRLGAPSGTCVELSEDQALLVRPA